MRCKKNFGMNFFGISSSPFCISNISVIHLKYLRSINKGKEVEGGKAVSQCKIVIRMSYANFSPPISLTFSCNQMYCLNVDVTNISCEQESQDKYTIFFIELLKTAPCHFQSAKLDLSFKTDLLHFQPVSPLFSFKNCPLPFLVCQA